jgi:hypothetical protein
LVFLYCLVILEIVIEAWLLMQFVAGRGNLDTPSRVVTSERADLARPW